MDARLKNLALLLAILPLAIAVANRPANAASSRARNFIVYAPNPQLAHQVAQAAERFRRDLAVEWLGRELPDWEQKCPIVVKLATGAGGRTSFLFTNGVPHRWDMEVQGTPERILDSVLPHEITHTIFATHFGCPVPRWADEGACTTVEHYSERQKQQQWLIRFLKTQRGIPFNHMFAMTEYPRDILPLYSQGYSLARYLIAQGGKQEFVRFIGTGLERGDWTYAVHSHYGYDSLGDLQLAWVDWVTKGSPEKLAGPDVRVVSNQNSTRPSRVTPASRRDGPIALASAQLPTSRRPQIAKQPSADDQRAASTISASGQSWYARRQTADTAPRGSRPRIDKSSWKSVTLD